VNGSEVLLVRGDGSPSLHVSAARSSIRALDPELAVFGVEPLVDTLSQSVGERRFVTLVLSVFAGLALLLAAIGVHGLLSYSVARRRREIGIRMALGAAPRRVVALVVGQGMRLAALGVVVGMAGALALGRVLGSLLFGVTPTDVKTLLVVLPVMGTAALLASYLPARRSARVSPTLALRD
jgi:ABC-type antimicrobial peptide transport system permease subunit